MGGGEEGGEGKKQVEEEMKGRGLGGGGRKGRVFWRGWGGRGKEEAAATAQAAEEGEEREGETLRES